TSFAENNFLMSLVPAGLPQGAGAWLGGKAPEGWLDGPEAGQPFTFTNFGGVEPNNAGFVYLIIGSAFPWGHPGPVGGRSGAPGGQPRAVGGWFRRPGGPRFERRPRHRVFRGVRGDGCSTRAVLVATVRLRARRARHAPHAKASGEAGQLSRPPPSSTCRSQ